MGARPQDNVAPAAKGPRQALLWLLDRRRRYYLLCAASAAVWAIIAYGLAGGGMGRGMWGGLVAAPLIGLVVGAIYNRAYRWSLAGRLAMSLLTLYVAVLGFGLACGVFDCLRGLPGGRPRDSFEVIYQGAWAALYAVTCTGFVALLWPLAQLNHWFVGRLAGRHRQSTRPPDAGRTAPDTARETRRDP